MTFTQVRFFFLILNFIEKYLADKLFITFCFCLVLGKPSQKYKKNIKNQNSNSIKLTKSHAVKIIKKPKTK